MASSRVDEKNPPIGGFFFGKFLFFRIDILLMICYHAIIQMQRLRTKSWVLWDFCSFCESWSSNIWGQGMRKTGMILVGLFGILVAGGADAVYKCANVYEGMKCDNPKVVTGGVWSATCGDTEIKGISMCGNDYFSDRDELFMSPYVISDKVFCFCKMIKPAVTTWVLIQESTINDAVKCRTNCETACANAFVYDTDELRSTMIKNIVR